MYWFRDPQMHGTTSFGAFYVKIDVRVFAVTEKWKK